MSAFGNRKRPTPLRTTEPYRRKDNTDDPGADFARNTESNPFITAFMSGREIVVEFDGTQSVNFKHGLGRPYKGVHIQWVSDTRRHVQAFTPEGFDSLGGDVSTYASVGVISSGSLGPWTGTCGVYVY